MMYLNKLRDQAVRVAKGSTSRRITLITKCKCIQEENVAISGRLIDAARAAEPGEAKAFTDNICVGTSNEEWLEAYRRHVLGRRKELIALAVFDILYICGKRCIDVDINEAGINERIRDNGDISFETAVWQAIRTLALGTNPIDALGSVLALDTEGEVLCFWLPALIHYYELSFHV